MQGSKPAFHSRLQQQPQRVMDRQQQQSSGSREFQPKQARPVERQTGQMNGNSDYPRGPSGGGMG